MKKSRIFKLILVCGLIAAMVFSFSACGNKTAKASDATGTAGELNWSYTSNDQTLTISGSGDMPNFASADEVSWVAVRESVVTVKFVGSAETGGVTAIGDYAFYYMPALKTVEIPAAVKTIGKSAFAFCTSLENITVPEGVSTVGEGAFEGCSALKSIILPASVTSLGARAFAYCSALTDASIIGVLEIPAYAFRNCTALTALNLNGAITADATAFEGAAKNIENASKIGTEGTVTVKYVLEDGTTNAFDTSKDIAELKALGAEYSYTSPDKEGYTPDKAVVSGISAGVDETIIVTYTKNAEETVAETEAVTEAPAETEANADEEQGITWKTVAALIIMGVVIVAIIIGAVLLMRGGKDDKKNGSKNGKNNSNGKKSNNKGKK